ncbi:hypothetical protein BOTNAR_0075g00070 [Botryotinia narcissicola]|uniref:Pectate lyase superfamily protein domain-containing protein n=1 Tax=Botryotinia narcissicola TaxID=278944 RepID=A0A4Z1J9N5_9HELO|nr:hypothetical protein BOTNAR_0075g00070 [Botryotinia narcissicola]
MFSIKASLLLFLHLGLFSQAQLTGPVGATTPLSKKTIECNIRTLYPTFNPLTDDVSIPITNAFTSCVQKHAGSRLIVPAGNYTLKTSIILSNATNWAFQLDGLITATYYPNSTDSTYVVPYVVPRARILEGFAGVEKLNSTIDGEGDGEFLENLIVIINAVDFELYSANGLGAIQGQGYLYRINGNTNRPRMLRLISPINATVHDLLLIDSPKFHFIFDFGENIEVYHLTIRGANLGSYDGIDAIGTNYWVHDNEHARNISVLGGNEIVFIKTYPGGSGYVSNILWENFRSKASLYGINLNQYWQQTYLPDSGAVALTNITFRNFTGSIQNGAQRPALYLLASDYIPATNVTIKDVTIWTESGSTSVNHISNIFGQGDNVYGTNDGLVSLGAGENPKTKTYTSTYTITSAPTGWATPTWPSWAVPTTGYGTAVPIPVYTPAPLWKPQGDYDKHYWGTF